MPDLKHILLLPVSQGRVTFTDSVPVSHNSVIVTWD